MNKYLLISVVLMIFLVLPIISAKGYISLDQTTLYQNSTLTISISPDPNEGIYKI